MKKKRDRLRVREIEVERLVVREPRGGRARVIVETGSPRPGMELPLPSARITLVDGRGNPRIVAEVDAEGHATLFVGGPDEGPLVTVTPTAVDLWSLGNIVASVRSDGARGVVEPLNPAARPRRTRRRPRE